MEDWEEDSIVESCRSSVISDLDELEANLYSLLHHERNEAVDETSSYEGCVIPIKDGVLGILDNVPVITEQNIKSRKHVELAEEKERSGKQEEREVTDQNNVKLDHPKSCKQDVSNEYTDSRYNVGCVGENRNEDVIPTSSVTVTVESNSPSPKHQRSSPIVIDVLSSEDEEPNVHPVNNVPLKIKQSTEEVLILDDSDSDIKIELEKVNVGKKKRKKKTLSKISKGIVLNTVNSSRAKLFHKLSNFHSSELENVQPVSVTPNVTFTPDNEEYCISSVSKSWTPQMIHFYQNSWGGENLTLSEILFPMSDNGWHLDITDEFSILPGSAQDRRYFGNSKAWCTNCNRRGHTRGECAEEKRSLKCRRCGSPEHTEYRCQEKLCLTCGKKTRVIVKACQSCRSILNKGRACSVCSLKGHPSNCCPDLWRRFHATVVPGSIVHPKKVLYKNSMNMYCCNCATKGHHVYQCKKKKFGDYIPCSPKVIKYEDPSLEIKEIDSSTISENWGKERTIASENRIEETPKSSKTDNAQRGTRRPCTSNENRNSKVIKLSETEMSARETKVTATSVSTKVNLLKEKKKPKKPKKKVNQSMNQSQMSQNAEVALGKDQPVVRDKVNPSSGALAVKDGNKQQGIVFTNLDRILAKKKDKKIVLSRREYQMLMTKQGEEVLKYVTRSVKGSSITLIHGKPKVLLFIGGRKTTTRAKKLMRSIIDNKDFWNSIAGSDVENGSLKKSLNKIEKTSSIQAASKSYTRDDLRVEIRDPSLQNIRSVTCLQNSKPNHIQGPNNNKDVITGKNKQDIKQSETEIVNSKSRAISTIKSTARTLLKKNEFTAEKLKLFSSWALLKYGDIVKGYIKYNLKALSKVNENGKPIELFRRNLLAILKWR